METQTAGAFGPFLERLILRHRKLLVAAIELGLIVAAYIASFAVRFDFNLERVPWGLILPTLPLVVAARLATLWAFRLYQGLWRYVSVPDLVQIFKAVTVGSLIIIPAIMFLGPFFGVTGFPRSIYLLDWAINLFFLSGARLSVRLTRERFRPMRSLKPAEAASKRMLIIGAGDAGADLCGQILRTPSYRHQPVAFIDDDPRKVGESIQGVSVAGTSSDLQRVMERYQPDLAVIAIPSATPAQRRRLVERCQAAGLECKVLPGTPDLIEGSVNINLIRDVDPADLLGRPPARLDRAAISGFIRGKRALVTGAAGSVGSELARQIARLGPSQLILLDQAENPLFFLEAELRGAFPNLNLASDIVDITDAVGVRRAFRQYRPEVVMHAAAHKHVGFMERVPARAVLNNVGGTYVVARAAQDWGVPKFVLVSTDKAVRPTSVMGATKRLGELLIQDLDRQGPTRFVAVRFGNVLGSNASVVPIFKQQIAQGGPITVTHPDVSRYFMSIPEAAGLILQAGAIGQGGEIVVLDMGEPVRIVDLARAMITLSGLKEGDVEIKFTTLKPGEKLHEELYNSEEEFIQTGYEKLMVLKNGHAPAGMASQVEGFLRLLPELENEEVKEHLRHLVPEYRPASQPKPAPAPQAEPQLR